MAMTQKSLMPWLRTVPNSEVSVIGEYLSDNLERAIHNFYQGGVGFDRYAYWGISSLVTIALSEDLTVLQKSRQSDEELKLRSGLISSLQKLREAYIERGHTVGATVESFQKMLEVVSIQITRPNLFGENPYAPGDPLHEAVETIGKALYLPVLRGETVREPVTKKLITLQSSRISKGVAIAMEIGLDHHDVYEFFDTGHYYKKHPNGKPHVWTKIPGLQFWGFSYPLVERSEYTNVEGVYCFTEDAARFVGGSLFIPRDAKSFLNRFHGFKGPMTSFDECKPYEKEDSIRDNGTIGNTPPPGRQPE